MMQQAIMCIHLCIYINISIGKIQEGGIAELRGICI